MDGASRPRGFDSWTMMTGSHGNATDALLLQAGHGRTAARATLSTVTAHALRIRRALWLVALSFIAILSSSHGAVFKPKVAVAAFGLYGDQSVFESEAKGAAHIVAERFGGSPAIVRANAKQREDANLEKVAATLQAAAKVMDVEHDILFV